MRDSDCKSLEQTGSQVCRSITGRTTKHRLLLVSVIAPVLASAIRSYIALATGNATVILLCQQLTSIDPEYSIIIVDVVARSGLLAELNALFDLVSGSDNRSDWIV